MKPRLFVLLFLIIIIESCKDYEIISTNKNLEKITVIPRPTKFKPTNNFFVLSKEINVVLNDSSEEMGRIAKYFAKIIQPATGYLVETKFSNKPISQNFNFFISKKLYSLGKEGYKLTIENDILKLEAYQYEGIFRGIQTIRQLFPPIIEKKAIQNNKWKLPACKIEDFPNYTYRGSMLDVARHFFTVDEVKKYIDWLARYKMNVMHLHLTDDQGWRIEIKKWPKLTQIGGKSEVGTGKGGYYSQEQYKEIVKYASERYITIIPEIDMPGHTNAALASYAKLNCDNKIKNIYTGTKVGFSSLCINKKITYQFVDDVLSEIAKITPGPYIHIGGDEANNTSKKDYIYFMNKVQETILSNGKKMIGWNEVSNAYLDKTTVVQFWSEKEETIMASKKGLKIIMSPAERAYLDMKYSKKTHLGQHWAGTINLSKAYNWNLEDYIPEIKKENILGVECPLWTETISNMSEIEYMVFPRLIGYAELGWSQRNVRDWDDYRKRLIHHTAVLKEMNINYYKSYITEYY